MAIDIKRHVDVSVDSFERKVPHALIRVFASDSDGFPSYQVGKKKRRPSWKMPMPIGCESGEAPDLMILAGSGVFKRCGVLRATVRLCQFLWLCIGYFSPVVGLDLCLSNQTLLENPRSQFSFGKINRLKWMFMDFHGFPSDFPMKTRHFSRDFHGDVSAHCDLARLHGSQCGPWWTLIQCNGRYGNGIDDI